MNNIEEDNEIEGENEVLGCAIFWDNSLFIFLTL
jgi:hypothetical protein